MFQSLQNIVKQQKQSEEVNLGTQKKQSCFLEVDKQCLRVHVLYFEAVN